MVKNLNCNELEKRMETLGIKKTENWAIYGTGNAAKLLYESIGRTSFASIIKYVIDQDEKVKEEQLFLSTPVVKLQDVMECLDGILIAAFVNYKTIEERISSSLNVAGIKKVRVVNIFTYSTDAEKLEYIKYIENGILQDKKEFVEYSSKAYEREAEDTKVIAWYLPQFHQMEINNKFHGQGFTEWSNTTRMQPLFTGHYQPHIPYDVGYYDLLNIDTWKRQIHLAKHYGIYGFCIHYYWFSGKRIMEKPLELLLAHKELDIPFCFNWATENWTALWDGGNKEIMLEQKLEEDDDRKFMEDILPYMKDSRYIKIDEKPILIIYRINMFEKERAKILLQRFRELACNAGFKGLYIMVTAAYEFYEDVTEWGADALVEFPPHGIIDFMEEVRPEGYINPYFCGTVNNATSFIENKDYMLVHNNKTYFRSAMVSWDNSARKAVSGARIIQGLTPKTFYTWLKDIMEEGKRIHKKSEDIVFINSWNEWAEGSHLEPDMKYGYAWLQAVKDILEILQKERK